MRGGGGELQSGGVTGELSYCQGETMCSNCHKIYRLTAWPISWTSRVVISSKVAACTSQPVAFNGYLSIRGRLTGFRNKPEQK